eukprot:1160249-Pelagomonas_calceolata.AAC.6
MPAEPTPGFQGSRHMADPLPSSLPCFISALYTPFTCSPSVIGRARLRASGVAGTWRACCRGPYLYTTHATNKLCTYPPCVVGSARLRASGVAGTWRACCRAVNSAQRRTAAYSTWPVHACACVQACVCVCVCARAQAEWVW